METDWGTRVIISNTIILIIQETFSQLDGSFSMYCVALLSLNDGFNHYYKTNILHFEEMYSWDYYYEWIRDLSVRIQCIWI